MKNNGERVLYSLTMALEIQLEYDPTHLRPIDLHWLICRHILKNGNSNASFNYEPGCDMLVSSRDWNLVFLIAPTILATAHPPRYSPIFNGEEDGIVELKFSGR